MSSGNAPPLDRLVKALTSTISLKIVMAVTGIAGAGFVIFHMLGNLQMFLGPEAYNTYAEFMQNRSPVGRGPSGNTCPRASNLARRGDGIVSAAGARSARSTMCRVSVAACS